MAVAEALSISDAAREVGVSPHTLRYYERAGLMLEAVDRAASTHRRYSESDIRWVTLLMRLRNTGMPIRTIAEYAELVRAGDSTEAERLALLQRHRDEVLEHLEETRHNLEAIERKIAVYESRSCS